MQNNSLISAIQVLAFLKGKIAQNSFYINIKVIKLQFFKFQNINNKAKMLKLITSFVED